MRALFIIVLIYIVVRYLLRLFAPFLMKKAAETIQKKAEAQFRNQQPKSNVKEGETVIDKAPKNNNQSKNSVGEYVDFEEID